MTISHNCNDADDLCAKRTSLIRQVNGILCTFRNVNCSNKNRLAISLIVRASTELKRGTCLIKAYRGHLPKEQWHQENIAVAQHNTTHSVVTPKLCETLLLVANLRYLYF